MVEQNKSLIEMPRTERLVYLLSTLGEMIKSFTTKNGSEMILYPVLQKIIYKNYRNKILSINIGVKAFQTKEINGMKSKSMFQTGKRPKLGNVVGGEGNGAYGRIKHINYSEF